MHFSTSSHKATRLPVQSPGGMNGEGESHHLSLFHINHRLYCKMLHILQCFDIGQSSGEDFVLVLTASASNNISTCNNGSDLSVSRDSEYIFGSLWVSCLSKNITICVFVSLRL